MESRVLTAMIIFVIQEVCTIAISFTIIMFICENTYIIHSNICISKKMHLYILRIT